MATFVTTDIHGCCQSFKALLDKIKFSKSDQLYLLGDYIDRGPDSKGVIDTIWEKQEKGYQIFCLKGNHEEKMVDALSYEADFKAWLEYGGRETLESFNAEKIDEVPLRYFEWMRTLPNYFELEDYLLVHAGFDFNNPSIFINTHAMRWIRNWYIDFDNKKTEGRIILHGHTPITKNEIEKMAATCFKKDSKKQYIDLDNGCAYNKPGMNNLCCFNIDKKELIFQKNVD